MVVLAGDRNNSGRRKGSLYFSRYQLKDAVGTFVIAYIRNEAYIRN